MVKLQQFNISLLNNTNNVYYAGQEVQGVVRVRLFEAMKARQVRVQIEGAANTRWTETTTTSRSNDQGGTTTETHDEIYSDTETYINYGVTLWPPANQLASSRDRNYIPAGSYGWTFAFQIPETCPTSIEGPYGHIRYTCRAVIDRPWRFDEKCKLPFTVISLVDLNREPDALRPIIDTKSVKVGCWCCLSGNLECNVNIERCGYVPGENIPLNFGLSNNSSSTVKKVTAKLVENAIFTAKHGWSEHSKLNSRNVAELCELETVPAGGYRKWHGKFLAIPPVAPTIKTCRIIRLNYELHIKAEPDACCSTLYMTFPILIGSVPLRAVYQNVLPQVPSSPSATEPSAPELPAYPDLPPPSYEEAIFGGGDIQEEGDDEHTSGPKNFAPRYPYYNWSKYAKASAPLGDD